MITWIAAWAFANPRAAPDDAVLAVDVVRLATAGDVVFGHVPDVRATLTRALLSADVPARPWEGEEHPWILRGRVIDQTCDTTEDAACRWPTPCWRVTAWLACRWRVRFFVVDGPTGAPIAWADGVGAAARAGSVLTSSDHHDILAQAATDAVSAGLWTRASSRTVTPEPAPPPPLPPPPLPDPRGRTVRPGQTSIALGSAMVIVGATVAASVGQAWILSTIDNADPRLRRTFGTVTAGGLIITASGVALLQFGVRRWRDAEEARPPLSSASSDVGGLSGSEGARAKDPEQPQETGYQDH